MGQEQELSGADDITSLLHGSIPMHGDIICRSAIQGYQCFSSTAAKYCDNIVAHACKPLCGDDPCPRTCADLLAAVMYVTIAMTTAVSLCIFSSPAHLICANDAHPGCDDSICLQECEQLCKVSF